MMHSILVGAVYVAIVITPCVVAQLTGVHKAEDVSESSIYEDGFI
jgi:hypothetical protein